MWTLFKPKKPRPRLPDGLRIYAVSDLHGRAELLRKLFAEIDAEIAAHPAARVLHVFLGDYIDRGPASREVIDLILARRATHETVLLKGNHEIFPLQAIDDPSTLGDWYLTGGLATLASYGLKPDFDATGDGERKLAAAFAAALPESHADFFRRLQLSFSCGDFFFVHAGVKPGVPLAQQSADDMLWIRHEFLDHEGAFEKLIVHGHTPVPSVEFRPNRINIDTSRAGRLAALAIEGDVLRLIEVTE